MTTRTKRRLMERKIVELLLAGSSLVEICRTLRVSKRRVCATRAKADEAGYLSGTSLPPYPEALFSETPDGRSIRVSPAWQELEKHLPWITERLDVGWHAITVYEELPVKVRRSSFYRFLIRHRLEDRGRSARRVIPEIVHRPGEALLIDWGHLWTITQDGKRKKLWAFVGVLGYSRYLVVRLMTECTLERTLHELASMYAQLGGVPLRTTSDNPKVFALQADKFEPILNPAYERFAGHYGTIIECLPPKTPTQKGKVERAIPYVRRLLEAYSGDCNDLNQIQSYLEKKLDIANSRRHGATNERPVDRFKEQERATLKPLPPLAYQVEQYHEGIVRRDGHVRFDSNYYSLSEDFIAKSVSILGNAKTVAIYHTGKLIETHERITDRKGAKSTKPHHRKPWEQACENPEWLRAMASKIGPAVEDVVLRVLLEGDGFINFRRIWGILSLNKKYSADEINSACIHAIEVRSYSSRAIEDTIRRAREERTDVQSSRRLPPGKFQRPITEYTQMFLTLKKPTGGIYEH